MRVIDIEDVVYAMRNQTQFVLRCEEVFHDKISSAAAAILSAQPRKPFVCLTGPSGSGKTTTAMRLQFLSAALRAAKGLDRLGVAPVRQPGAAA